MVLQVGLQPVLGAFGSVLGGQATKSTVLVRPKGLYCVNFELGDQVSLDQWYFMLAFTSHGWFWLCFGWPGHKIHCLCEAKRHFLCKFWTGGTSAYPTSWFWFKLSSKGKPGTCALLETLQSPVNFFRRAKFLRLLYKFCTLPTYFYKYWWFFNIRWNQRWAAF